jgi:hypothetical protein
MPWLIAIVFATADYAQSETDLAAYRACLPGEGRLVSAPSSTVRRLMVLSAGTVKAPGNQLLTIVLRCTPRTWAAPLAFHRTWSSTRITY